MTGSAKQSISHPSCERSEPRRICGPAGGRRPSRRAQERAPQGDGSRYDSAISRRDAPEVFKSSAQRNRGRRECRMLAAPAVSCAKMCEETHTSIQVQSEHSGIPCAMVLRLIPRSPRRRIRLATVADGLKDCLNPVGSTRLRQLDTSNGCQDHTALPYAASRLRRRLRRALPDFA